jgi:hypothetical protein
VEASSLVGPVEKSSGRRHSVADVIDLFTTGANRPRRIRGMAAPGWHHVLLGIPLDELATYQPAGSSSASSDASHPAATKQDSKARGA